MLSKGVPAASSIYSPSMKCDAFGWALMSFSPRVAFGFLEIVEVHVVAHVALGCLLQRLVIPGIIAAVAQRLVDHPAPRLAFAHGCIEGGHVPARLAHLVEGIERRLDDAVL